MAGFATVSEGFPEFSSVRKPDRPTAADPFVFVCTGDVDLGLLVVGETECSLWRSILGLLILDHSCPSTLHNAPADPSPCYPFPDCQSVYCLLMTGLQYAKLQ
jgi:hypothetical protein